ncbi:abl interactor 2 isoform X2 [Aplysia californica]|uniref:Abl interactor 2 isoform X2 n=1 Tax=Aplysia californica TaxID=6500 RepID=A0ABM0JGF9_APLCA|nr:abl interactor 2 isoform X2 [Aplysia californica]
MAAGEELISLIDREIPDGRKNLQENYRNLENVAKYCEDYYLRANPSDKAHALQETKNYTTHSLASVAYQINNLATNFLKLLDLQQSQLTDMESSVNHLNQFVMIHKEKVARREIGVLTSGRSVHRPLGMKNGIIYPEQNERPIKYTRKSIDYTILDDIGHGVRQQQQQQQVTVRSPSISSTHSNSSTNNNQAPTTKPPTPPVGRVGSSGTIGRASGGHYRSLGPPVAPPVAPQSMSQGNFPPHPQSSRSSVSSGGSYSPSNTLVMGQIHHPSMSGMGQPMQPPGGGGYSHSQNAHHHNMPLPSQSALMHPEAKEMSTTSLPPPPDDDISEPFMVSQASPPLPPPPTYDQNDQFDYTPPPPHDFSDVRQGPPSTREGRMIGSIPEDTYGVVGGGNDDPYAATGPQLLAQPTWIPKHYLEKVVAIYDYQAIKSDELSFAENAVVYVIHKNDDGWWEGVMDGQTGLFPYNYVEPCM